MQVKNIKLLDFPTICLNFITVFTIHSPSSTIHSRKNKNWGRAYVIMPNSLGAGMLPDALCYAPDRVMEDIILFAKAKEPAQFLLLQQALLIYGQPRAVMPGKLGAILLS